MKVELEKMKEAHDELGIDDVSAAILVLANAINNLPDNALIGHQICMGIRKGLFGADSSSDSSIESLKDTKIE